MFQRQEPSLSLWNLWLINDETNFLKAGKAKFLCKAVDEPHVDWLLLFIGWKSWIPRPGDWPTPCWSWRCCRALLFAPPWVVPGVRGGINKKKTVFFLQKNSEILRPPRPLPAIWRPQFFLIRKFWNWQDPHPPFGKKFRNIFSFLF